METNPYVRFFRSLRDVGIQEWNRIVVKVDPTHDQRTHSAPSASQVAGWHRCIYRRNVRCRPNQQVKSFPINEVLVQTVEDLLYSEEQGIIDSYNAGKMRSSNIGYRLILPTTFIGCGRDMHCRYLNSMGLVQRFGKPDIFLTIICNPQWPEIVRELLPSEEARNRHDLIARIFRSKLIELKKDIVEKQHFGKVAGYVCVIEFQKRGLPHAHFLIILHLEYKIRNPESYDIHVSAEIPDDIKFPHLHAAVLKHMIHGPCGRNFPTNPYMRDPNVHGALLDNRWVVPYNAFLLAKYDCHLNVEVCSTVKAVKYLYKYVYKGHDRISFALTESDPPTTIDEISSYNSARWVSPPEAAWRIFRFYLNEIHPNIVVMQKKNDKFLAPRQSGFTIGRLVYINPSEGERHYLRLLLKNVRRPLSFDDLLTVNDLRCTTFREPAYRRGLLEADNSIEKCLEEASQYQLPFVLRRLFATLLIYCQPKSPRDLFEKFNSHLSADFALTFSTNPRKVFIMTLKSISSIIESMGKSFDSFDFGGLTVDADTADQRTMKEIEEGVNISITTDDIDAVKLLNSEQRIAYNLINDTVMRGQSGSFFLDGPGGTGKTFIYSTLLANLRSRGIIALDVASSGIVASNIAGGRTANSRFKIPLDTDEHLSNQIPRQSGLAKLIRACRLII
ncbi:hypothetical protein RND81_03G060200 [Saponaria officinalis]|uniref:ATP-dependent DNA helicase n=1 Tax=Saponaria officinalis TaxID=3572 RepID=A0AAW1M535_SAPOF